VSDPALATLSVGSVFNARYRVVRIIKSGGMGSVYEVLDETTNSPRALKVMLPSVVEDADQRARFALEAKITGNIESDHLLRIFDAGIRDTTGEPFIVMDLLRGEELQAMLTKRGPLPPEEVLVYLTQLARVLEKTHAAGIVHRDLKPENLFVTRRDDGSPSIKVLDFGIAKVVAQQQAQKTRALGTPLYMAPEQIRGEATIGPRADLYSFAQVAYTALSGEAYWLEESKSHDSLYPLLMALLGGAKEAASARAQRRTGARLPPGFDAWYHRATSPNPEARFESAMAEVNALAAVLRGQPVPAGGYAAPGTPYSTGPASPAPYGAPAGPTMPSAYAPPPAVPGSLPYASTGPTGAPQPMGYGAPPPVIGAPQGITPAYLPVLPHGAAPAQVSAPQWGPGQPPPHAAPTWGTGQPPPPGAVPAKASGPKWIIPVVIGAVAITGIIVLGVVLTSGGGGGNGGTMAAAPAGACGNVAVACVTIKVPDVHHVDPFDILPQARKLALSVDSRATLNTIFVTSTKDGTVDIAGGYGTLSYMYSTPDGTLSMTVRDPYTAVVRGPSIGTANVIEPKCSMKAAYKAVIAAGAPADKPMTMTYNHSADIAADVWFANSQNRMYYLDSATCVLKKVAP